MQVIGASYCDECGGTGFHLEGCNTYESEEIQGQSPLDFESREDPAQPKKIESEGESESPPELVPILRRAAVDFLTWAAYRIDPKTGQNQ